VPTAKRILKKSTDPKKKFCAGPCGKELHRFDDFAPRWGHCEKHKPWDENCKTCQELRAHPTRQPQCYDCDRTRAKKVAEKKAKAKGGKKAPKATAPKKTKTKKKSGALPKQPQPETTTTPPTTTEAPAPEATTTDGGEATKTPAALMVAGDVPTDMHGPLTRTPVAPKRGYAVTLRRRLKTFKRRCHSAARWEKEVRDVQERLAAAKEGESPAKVKAAKMLSTRLVSFQSNLVRARAARTLTETSIRQCVELIQTKTLKCAAVATRHGTKRYEKLLERVDDIVDTAYLQAGGSGASEAFTRIAGRIGNQYGKLVANRVNAETMRTRDRAHAEENAKELRDVGIYKGAAKWNPYHKKGATLATKVFYDVKRELQIRTKADRAIGVLKDAKTNTWQSAALSLDKLTAESTDAEGGFEPFASRYSLRGAKQHVSAAAADEDRKAATDSDVRAALATLSSDDRLIAERVLINQDSRATVAEGMKISVTAVNTRLTLIVDSLRDKLTAYDDAAEGDNEL
jgi:DNA-directed RNA polymerase specialized sigma24 family protein